MVMPGGATLISIGIGSSLFCFCLDESQDGSSGSAIRIFDLQRETDQFVCSRCYFSKVEALDEPDACLKQRMVGLDSVLGETTDREIINADGLHLLCCKILCGLLRDIDKILDKVIGLPAPGRVPCLE